MSEKSDYWDRPENQPTGPAPVNTHGLERTSPFGGPFLGRCRYCGQDNLPMKAALEPCGKAPSQGQQVLDALEPAPASVGGVAPDPESEEWSPLHIGRIQGAMHAHADAQRVFETWLRVEGYPDLADAVAATGCCDEQAEARLKQWEADGSPRRDASAGLLAGLEALQKEWREMMDRANEQAAVFAPDSPAFLLYRYEAATLKERIDGLARLLATRQEGNNILG